MAFDLVQYFAEQIKIQKPQLLNQYSVKEKAVFIQEINALALARLISLWKQNAKNYIKKSKLRILCIYKKLLGILRPHSIISQH
jgi:hypothetical protein